MSRLDIIRAWKDEQYRKSLSPEEQSALPENPAGQIELTDGDLQDINGGTVSEITAVISASVAVSAWLCGSWSKGGTCGTGGAGC